VCLGADVLAVHVAARAGQLDVMKVCVVCVRVCVCVWLCVCVCVALCVWSDVL